MAELRDEVLQNLHENDKPYFDGRDVESGLSRLRRLASLIADGEPIRDLTVEGLKAVDEKACATIIEALDVEAKMEGFDDLGAWAAGVFYDRPVEIITVNYDLLIERGLDGQAAPYFDGFVGTIRARFREDLVEPAEASIPPFFTRLWKLHGSLNWQYEHKNGGKYVVRLGGRADEAAAIYPTDEKYDESRRVPFVVLMDRFRRSLSETETLSFFCGYSFRDQHLNDIIYDAAARHPRNHYACLSHDAIPDDLSVRAQKMSNITVIAKEEYISAGLRAKYRADEGNIPNISDGANCLLPDFPRFAAFLRGSEALASGTDRP